ncbi:hypothetical protein TM48_01434 [Mycobacterium shottsii]|uniref:DUF4258 domain-containing protein n=1 Tax=Mycobacterium shottsii TaxID=133549 RepID=A0A7I7LA95_9MYCO|nr:hypothetical protein TM48_01434 [Mycobacterium shottsii]BBX56951.1 hypothetical protein MSHO_22960 [Mycobacterium shottsii]
MAAAYARGRKGILYATTLAKVTFTRVEIRASARKHGISDEAMLHAYRNALRYVELEYNGEVQLLVIGTDQTGRLIELVIPADQPPRIIHADELRQKFYSYLR